MANDKKYFFGWTNIKFLIKEFVKVWTSGSSFFSKKRIESSIAFIIGQIGMVWFLIVHVDKMSSGDIGLWAAIEFAIAGYMVNKIEKAKQTDTPTTTDDTTKV
jgi:hypothetical protein